MQIIYSFELKADFKTVKNIFDHMRSHMAYLDDPNMYMELEGQYLGEEEFRYRNIILYKFIDAPTGKINASIAFMRSSVIPSGTMMWDISAAYYSGTPSRAAGFFSNLFQDNKDCIPDEFLAFIKQMAS